MNIEQGMSNFERNHMTLRYSTFLVRYSVLFLNRMSKVSAIKLAPEDKEKCSFHPAVQACVR